MNAALQITASVASLLAAAVQIVYQLGPWHSRHASPDHAGIPRSETSEERGARYASIGGGATLILASLAYLFARSARAAAVNNSLREGTYSTYHGLAYLGAGITVVLGVVVGYENWKHNLPRGEFAPLLLILCGSLLWLLNYNLAPL
jgi:hypothetical protein